MGTNIATKDGFALQPQNMDEAMRAANMLSSSQMVPNAYKNKPNDTLVAMMMGAELGLNPIQALQNIAVINGRPSIYGDAMLALVQNHPTFQSIEESFDKDAMTATCTVTRKGSKPHTITYGKEEATAARLWGKSGPWTQYKERMLAMRARGFALRDQFADALCGLISAEEAEDMPRDAAQAVEKDITPQERETLTPDNTKKWGHAIAAFKRDGNLDRVLAKVDMSEEHQALITGADDVS